MVAYIIRRFIQSFLVILGVSIVVFLISRVSGDPAQLLLSMYATEEDVDAFRKIMGLEEPLIVQYGKFLSHALRGDFGSSYNHHLPVSYLIITHLPATIQLAVTSIAISVIIGIPAGIITAVRRGTLVDRVVTFIVLIGQSAPVFWIGMMLILIFSIKLNWLPAGTSGTWKHIVLPAVALSAYSITMVTRVTYASMVHTLQQDYITFARSKGLSPLPVLLRHALRNAVIPVLTLLGLQTGVLLGGAVITETIFAWPGLGRLAVGAVYNRDYPLIQGTVFLVSVGFVVINTLLDFTYHLVDPRIRFE